MNHELLVFLKQMLKEIKKMDVTVLNEMSEDTLTTLLENAYPTDYIDETTQLGLDEFHKKALTKQELAKTFRNNDKAIAKFMDILDKENLASSKRIIIDFIISRIKKHYDDLEELAGIADVKIEVKLLSEDAKLPTYAHDDDACADIFSVEQIQIMPNETKAVKTGIVAKIPPGWQLKIYPRSGLSLKTGLRIANSVGVIDSGYDQEIMVLLHNTGIVSYVVEKGDRIAQFSLEKVYRAKFVEKTELDILNSRMNENGESGMGSTGN